MLTHVLSKISITYKNGFNKTIQLKGSSARKIGRRRRNSSTSETSSNNRWENTRQWKPTNVSQKVDRLLSWAKINTSHPMVDYTTHHKDPEQFKIQSKLVSYKSYSQSYFSFWKWFLTGSSKVTQRRKWNLCWRKT